MIKNEFNIAIVGFGNIGSYFYKTVVKNKKKIKLKTGTIVNIKYISARKLKKKGRPNIPKSLWIKNPLKVTLDPNIDVVVELVGGSDGISKKIVASALSRGKHVITANKSLISKHGDHLSYLAEKNNVNLEFEASVAGGIPIIRSIKEGLIGNKINKIYGILNGTTNFILSTMETTGKNFLDVLKKAQKMGFAETNPIFDLNGGDAEAKIRILSSLAFNTKLSKNKILVEGIQNINLTDIINTKKLGYKIKLLAISEIKNNKLMERVHPVLVLRDSYIAKINGVLNAIIVDGNPVGRSIFQGQGAGPGPTTSALISDLCYILKGNLNYPFNISYNLRKEIDKFNLEDHFCSSYLRIEVKDIPGVLSSITKIFAKYKISIKNLIQIPDKKNKKASIAIITHKSSEKNYSDLISNLSKNKFILKNPTFIRIETI